MIIEQIFTVDAPHAEAAAFFFDVDRMSGCIPGVEGVQEVEPGTYEATLAVRLGPIRAAFKGSLTLNDENYPEKLIATGEGRDRATGSVAKVTFTAHLEETEPGRTEVRAVADIALRGRMAQFGTGIMRAASEEMVREFAVCANRKLAEGRETVAPIPVSPANETDAPAALEDDSPSEQLVPPLPTPPRETTTVPVRNRGLVSILFRSFMRSVARGFQRIGTGIERRLNGEAK